MNKYCFFIFSLLTIPQVYLQAALPNDPDYEELSLYYALLEAEKKDSTYTKAFEDYQQRKNTPHPQTSEKHNDTCQEVEAITQSFIQSFWGEPHNYSKAFSIAIELENKLSENSGYHPVCQRTAFLKLGEAYYLFKDYPKSISLLKQVISETPHSFEDNTSLEARRIVGICYANLHELDSSDYYFQSTLKSREIVLDRPMYNAIAVSNLACNSMLKGEYDKAIALFEAVLPFIKTGDKYGHIAGMYYGLGNAYYLKGEYARTGSLIDSIFTYAHKDSYNPTKRIKQAFTLGSKYYTAIDCTSKALAYSDSLLHYYTMDENHYTSQYISEAIQSVKDSEIQEQNQKIHAQYNRIITFSIICLFCFIVTIIITYLYLRQRKSHRMLVHKAEEWAHSTNDMIESDSDTSSRELQSPTKEDQMIMEKTIQYLITDKKYCDPNLTLTSLAHDISVNRSYLSKAINRITGKSFSEWLNEYRIREAIRLFSTMKSKNISFDEISFNIGYNNRTTFYRAFKKVTGLSPTTYLKNREEKKNLVD